MERPGFRRNTGVTPSESGVPAVALVNAAVLPSADRVTAEGPHSKILDPGPNSGEASVRMGLLKVIETHEALGSTAVPSSGGSVARPCGSMGGSSGFRRMVKRSS